MIHGEQSFSHEVNTEEKTDIPLRPFCNVLFGPSLHLVGDIFGTLDINQRPKALKYSKDL